MDIRHVLFPTDFSPASEPAGRVAAEMARSLGARLLVVHVVPPVTDPSLPGEWLAALAETLSRDVACETALLSGRAAHEIVAHARAAGIDLIVMGTHGRTGVSRALLGSVAERVVRTAPCLVLTVPPTMAARAAGAVHPEEVRRAHRCVACDRESPDLVCEACRARIAREAPPTTAEAGRARADTREPR